MTNLQSGRRKAGIVIAVLVLVDIAALLFLFAPLGGSQGARQQEYERTRLEFQAKLREVAPLRGMDKKLVEAQQQIADFYRDRLPSGYSEISAELGKLAAANGVRLSQGTYTTDPAGVAGVDRVKIEASLDGEYVAAVKFINALERARMFFIVESVTLAQEQGGKVRLQLRLETYLKSAAA